MKRAFPTKLILSLTMALIFCISFGYYNLDEDITNTGVSLQRDFSFSSFGQGIEKIVFMISGDRDDPNNITMQLQGNTIVVDKAFTAGSPTNTMEGVVTDSTIVGGTDNKITTGTANSLAGGQGNKISGSNSVIMGGSGNVINANTGIIMGGQENKITNAKAIIFGSHNEVTGKVSQSTDLENVILGNHIKLTNEGSGENVLMGSGYEFQGEKSFVRSTAGNKLSGSKTVIIDSPNGMIIQTGEAHGSALTMLGNFLLSSKGTGDIDTNETGAVKTITHCNCYNDGTQWYSVQNTAACNLLCDKKVAECGPDVNTCKSGDLVNKDQENIKGQFWGCEGTTGSTLITVQCVKCHEHFTGSIGTGGLDCKEETQTGTCDFKTSAGSQNGPTTITQTRSGNLQTWVPTTKAVYQNSNVDLQNGTTCSFTCSGGYYYKNVTDQCEVCPIGTWRGNGSTAKKCGDCEGNISNGYWILNANIGSKECKFGCNTGYHANPTSNTKCPANTGSISYTLNGGNPGSLSPTGRTYDSGFNVSNPTRIGYTFDGWTINGLNSELYYYGDYTTTNPQDIQYTKATKFKNLTAQNNGSINFSAKWKECPAGYYCPGDNTEHDCGCGNYCPAGSSKPTPCGPKQYSISNNASSCQTAQIGYYASGTCNQIACTKMTHRASWTSNSSSDNCNFTCANGYSPSGRQCNPKTIKIHLNTNGGNGGTSDLWYRYNTNTFYSNSSLSTILPSISIPSQSEHVFQDYRLRNAVNAGGDNERYIYSNGSFANDLNYDIRDNTTLYANRESCEPNYYGSWNWVCQNNNRWYGTRSTSHSSCTATTTRGDACTYCSQDSSRQVSNCRDITGGKKCQKGTCITTCLNDHTYSSKEICNYSSDRTVSCNSGYHPSGSSCVEDEPTPTCSQGTRSQRRYCTFTPSEGRPSCYEAGYDQAVNNNDPSTSCCKGAKGSVYFLNNSIPYAYGTYDCV